MKAALVGGVGFVGVNLAEELVSGGWDVVVVARESSVAKRPIIASRLTSLGAKLSSYRRITRDSLLDVGADVYFHLAGKVSGSTASMEAAHVKLLEMVVDAAGELGARVVYVSAVAAIGRVRGAQPGSEVVEEDEHLSPRVHVWETPYEKSKAMGEKLLVNSGASLRGKWAILRPGIVFGRWAYHGFWGSLYNAARRGISVCTSHLPLTPVKSLSRLLELAGRGSYDGLWVNAVAYNKPLCEYTEALCKLVRGVEGRCRRLRVDPLIHAVGVVAPRGSWIKEASLLLKRAYTYNSKYLAAFNWQELEDAVREYVDWYREYERKRRRLLLPRF